jgi:hypothetical protein
MFDGASPIAWVDASDVSTKYFGQIDHWVAVCKGPEPHAIGLHHDLTLGLGIAQSEDTAKCRAIGEMMERLGAGLGGLNNAPKVATFDKKMRKKGQCLAKDVFLPWVNAHGHALPATSHGLAYWSDWENAAHRAHAEATERWMLTEIAKGRLELTLAEMMNIGPYKIHLFVSKMRPRMRLAVMALPEGTILAAGADVSDDKQAAVREALMAALCRNGSILPGMFDNSETFLQRFRLTHVDQLHRRNAQELAVPHAKFALACPNDWGRQGHWVVRCLLETHDNE